MILLFVQNIVREKRTLLPAFIMKNCKNLRDINTFSHCVSESDEDMTLVFKNDYFSGKVVYPAKYTPIKPV